MTTSPAVVVSGGFDNLRSADLRFLEEASRLGPVTVLLWSDATLRDFNGHPPKFPENERLYLVGALRYVSRVQIVSHLPSPEALPMVAGFSPDTWAVNEECASAAKEAYCRAHRLAYRVISRESLKGFTLPGIAPSAPGRKKVVVTGCFDWLHSGHVRFFEEVSAYGDLYVVVGHDTNIRLLKGDGHPLLGQEERRYLVGSVRHVKQAFISSGEGWLDADPEIRRLKPDLYAVNQDGDQGGKREYCQKLGIEYLVLRRTPAPGLPPRTSTNLRGF
jgi:cytidyltransferase-like protein